MDKPIDNEDKQAWCKQAEANERAFAGPLLGGGCAIVMNPAKTENKYTHDVFVMLPGDLKQIRTRFNTADRYGIPPKTAITINRKDIERYSSKYQDIVLVLDIDFGDWRSIRYAPLREIRRAIKLGKAKLHAYQHRTNDTNGNAKESYVFDALWFPEFGRVTA